nr:hypothetical protein PanWU01x14_222030 [Ipomoea batatas]
MLGKKGQAVEDKIRRVIEREDELVEPITSESWLKRGRLSYGRPVPVPPQLLQAIRPEPAQVRQPTSPSDQREQRQETLPVPLQEGHRGNLPDPIIAFCSITDLTRTAPAKTPRPVANGVSTSGPIDCIIDRMRSKLRDRGDEDDELKERRTYSSGGKRKLINPNSGNWDGGRVDNLLNDRDKNHILQLNPSSGYPDTWNWPGDLRNIYSEGRL